MADIVPKERLGEEMGYYYLGQTAARAFGPSIDWLFRPVGDMRRCSSWTRSLTSRQPAGVS